MTTPAKKPPLPTAGKGAPNRRIDDDADDPLPEDLSAVLDRAMVEAAADADELDEEPPTDISRVLSAVVEDFNQEPAPASPKPTRR